MAADLRWSPTFGRDSTFACTALHLAILRQLHCLSPLALSRGQLHTILRGKGLLLGQKNLLEAIGELVNRNMVERLSAGLSQPRYRIFDRPWEDGMAIR